MQLVEVQHLLVRRYISEGLDVVSNRAQRRKYLSEGRNDEVLTVTAIETKVRLVLFEPRVTKVKLRV